MITLMPPLPSPPITYHWATAHADHAANTATVTLARHPMFRWLGPGCPVTVTAYPENNLDAITLEHLVETCARKALDLHRRNRR